MGFPWYLSLVAVPIYILSMKSVFSLMNHGTNGRFCEVVFMMILDKKYDFGVNFNKIRKRLRNGGFMKRILFAFACALTSIFMIFSGCSGAGGRSWSSAIQRTRKPTTCTSRAVTSGIGAMRLG